MLLTLVVVQVVYLLVDRAREKVSRLLGRKKPSGQLATAE